MKTKIISHEKVHKNSVLKMEVQGLSNLLSLDIVTSQTENEFHESFNTEQYMEDAGWMDGSSYISSRYTYGHPDDIEQFRKDIISFGEQFDIEEIDCLELFVFVFDAGNGQHLLVSNVEEHLCFNDLDFDDHFKYKPAFPIAHMVCGAIMDDSDVGTNISQCLMAHPKTKGFKVPGDELFEDLIEDETLPWSEYVEYYGERCFGDVKELKKGELYFDMFNVAIRLVVLNTELFPDRPTTDMNTVILGKFEFVKDIPDAVWMNYCHDSSNKFYNIELQNNAVLMHYGAVDKTSTTQEFEFDTVEEAKKFYDKKVISKLKSGYDATHTSNSKA